MAARFLEFLLLGTVSRALAIAPVENEEIGEKEEQAAARSKGCFQHDEGIPFEPVAAECGLTIADSEGCRSAFRTDVDQFYGCSSER